MPENWEDEVTTEKFDYRHYLDILRRRHLLFLALVLAGWVLVWGASWMMSPKYKSSTLILVQQPSISKSYVDPNVSDNLQERLQSITQQIMSRTRLLSIIDKFHLYKGGKHGLTPDEKVEHMRKDIEVELTRDQQNGSISAFTVSYSGPNPHIAQAVTGELTKLFIDANENTRQQQAVQTTDFIGSQLVTARAKLEKEEARVNAFQSLHQGELPSQQASNLQILSGLQAQLQSEEDALNTAKQQRVYEQSLLDQYRSMPGSSQSPNGGSTELTAIDQHLNTLQSNLAAMNARYTSRYPGVEQLKEEIAKTKKTRKALVAELNAAGGSKSAKNQTTMSPEVNSTYSVLILRLQSQLRANKAEIANRESNISSLQARISGYQARLNSQPAVQQQLASLTSSYQQAQSNYDDLLKKENASQMATSMEQMQEGQHFMVLDPPSLPLKPYSPKRLKMWAGGVGLGLLIGLLGVSWVEKVDDRLYSDEELSKLLPVGVLAEIPEIVTTEDEQKKRRYMLASWAIAALVCMTILSGAVLSYLHV